MCDNLPHLLPHLRISQCIAGSAQRLWSSSHTTFLWAFNRSMKDVSIVAPSHDWELLLSNSLLQDHMQFEPADKEKQVQDMLPLLNDEQHTMFDQVLHSVLLGWKQSFS